ncbi:unnamed protein product [Pieris brassicae]|uniref:Uncharacterized protein n=1 Tax=Pieris brassicae TaxID=7116 RepID=A0A9P0TH46_PIEBR|nr:unnamed protein product [Pieris brassicae]
MELAGAGYARAKPANESCLPRSSSLMSLAACMPSSFRFFSICLLRARAARSSADEAQPMAIARTAWLATRGSTVLFACSRLVVGRKWRRARAMSRTRALSAIVTRRLMTRLYSQRVGCRQPDLEFFKV